MRFLSYLLSLILLCGNVFAAGSFVVESIKVKGLVNVPLSTFYSNFSIKQGDQVSADNIKAAIVKLYKSKFFKAVEVKQINNSGLLVIVKERPIMSYVGFTGQKTLKKEMLETIFTKMHLQSGNPYSPDLIAKVKQIILDLGNDQGINNLNVEVKLEKLDLNRVRIIYVINEGERSKVKTIEIIGNKDVATKDLLDVMSLQPHIWSFFTDNDSYSALRLEKDLFAIKSLYLDLGYINAKVYKQKVDFIKDKVNIKIKVIEGDKYYIGKVNIAKKNKYHHQLVTYLNEVVPGKAFSRKVIMRVVKKIQDFYQDRGYAYVEVNPQMRSVGKHKVDLYFNIKPGSLIMVRHIDFIGNTDTNDQVLRREMNQNEAELYSSSHVRESIRKINNLGYIKGADCKLAKVKGHKDLADLNCKVTESPVISASASVGYGSQNGALFQLNFNHKSLLGTGYGFRFNATRMITAQSLSLGLYDPYFTKSGVSQNISFRLEQLSPARTTDSSWNNQDFAFENQGASLAIDYGIPISRLSRGILGFSIRTTNIRLGNDPYPSLQHFIDTFGNKFKELSLHLGWNIHGLDRAIFPTTGGVLDTSIEVGLPVSDFLRYYLLNIKGNYYYPLAESGWIVKTRGGFGYGRGYGSRGSELPFFKNFFAGGMDTVRGFAANSLGQLDSKNRSVGGAMLAYGSLGVILPQWLGEDVRLEMFMDAGAIGATNISSDDMRYSAGVALHWRTAIAPLVFSLATPLQRHSNDIREVFAFELGTVF